MPPNRASYSYESDNNPYGLFVTLNINIAKEFTHNGAIMEFTAAVDDLEGPVWPSGGFTVQGQMAQYFGHGAAGRAARHAKLKTYGVQHRRPIGFGSTSAITSGRNSMSRHYAG